jgi:hypothetical protein
VPKVPPPPNDPLMVILSELQHLRQELKASSRHLLPVDDAATYLGISPKTIRNGLSRGAEKPFPIRPVRVAGRVLFRRVDLDRFVESLGQGNG